MIVRCAAIKIYTVGVKMIRLFPVRMLVMGAAFAALIFLPGLCLADGFYADAHGGATFFDDEPARIASLVTQTSVHGHTNYDVGWLAGTSAGYEWNKGFAAELEFTFRQNHIDRIATSAALYRGGDMHSFSTMFNGYYRFHNETPFTPYIGGGIGEAIVVLNNARPTFGLDRRPFGGTDCEFAYQGIAGVSYPIASHFTAAVEYRYFASLRPGFEQGASKVSSSYYSHNAILRLVYNFE
jgi:OmpA-OmpF porin, OOP family